MVWLELIVIHNNLKCTTIIMLVRRFRAGVDVIAESGSASVHIGMPLRLNFMDFSPRFVWAIVKQ
jgi:hypothetical protein